MDGMRITDINWSSYDEKGVADVLFMLDLWGVRPIEYLTEALFLEVSAEPDVDKAAILANEIEVRLEDLRLTLKRFADEYHPEPSQAVTEAA